jgi:hypothetical protein
MILFTASTQLYEAGHVFPSRLEPSRGHVQRIAHNEPWRRMEEALERHRRSEEQPRATAYYGCAALEECARYIQSQICDPISGEPVGPQTVYFYRIEMLDPTKAVMALVFRGAHHLHDAEALREICGEYWRQPRHRWEFFEYLGREAGILERVDPPDQFAVMGAGEGYTNDLIQAKRLWPERR